MLEGNIEGIESVIVRRKESDVACYAGLVNRVRETCLVDELQQCRQLTRLWTLAHGVNETLPLTSDILQQRMKIPKFHIFYRSSVFQKLQKFYATLSLSKISVTSSDVSVSVDCTIVYSNLLCSC